jgi:TrmH family RNA methyltransferase
VTPDERLHVPNVPRNPRPGTVRHLAARDNPRVQHARRIAADAALARREGVVWIDGDHLARSALACGWRVEQAWITQEAFAAGDHAGSIASAAEVFVVPARLLAAITALDSPPAVAMLLRQSQPAPAIDPLAASLVLDRVQDPGNVGSILRSAAAFGFRQVIAMPGTAALWSAKVLRAGMGAHFALRLFEQADDAMLDALRVPWLGTSSHASEPLEGATLPSPCAWVIGHEGQGMAAALAARCTKVLRIAQPGGEESLNAAVAAAICMHESVRRAPMPA